MPLGIRLRAWLLKLCLFQAWRSFPSGPIHTTCEVLFHGPSPLPRSQAAAWSTELREALQGVADIKTALAVDVPRVVDGQVDARDAFAQQGEKLSVLVFLRSGAEYVPVNAQ